MEIAIKSNFQTKKLYLISKLDKGNTNLMKKISDYFEDPNKYFSNSNILINKSTKNLGPRYDSSNKLIPYSEIGPIEHTQKHKPFLTKRKTQIFKETIDFPSQNYIRLDDFKLKTLCLNVKNRVENSKINDFLFKIPKETKEILSKQEKSLNLDKKYKSEKGLLERVLSHRSKKSSADLLINRTDFFRKKKEIKESYEDNKRLDERYGDNTWVMGLRRPVIFKGSRFCYVNSGSAINPIWGKVNEIVKENEKISVAQSKNMKEIDPFLKSDYFKRNILKNEENCYLEVNKFSIKV